MTLVHALCFATLLTTAPGSASTFRGTASCQSVHLNLDPSVWNTAGDAFLGRAVGQTFFAQDTVVSSITVWRPPSNLSVIGAHLYITGVDSFLRPDVDQLLLDGPTVQIYDSVPPGQLIAMTFILDPPLNLPAVGTYAFFLQAADCHQGSVWYIVASDQNPYPGGLAWITHRAPETACHLWPVEAGGDNTDLLFDIEFCDTHTTPVLSRSWGEVKVIYR